MRVVHDTRALDAVTADDLPRSERWRDELLDAAVLACAVVARANGRVPAAARMCLLAETLRRGLVSVPPRREALALLEVGMSQVLEPRIARRQVARSMNRFVGTPWAATVIDIATAFADAGGMPAARVAPALSSLRVALGLSCEKDC